ncbi:hypothetical protein [Gilliamella sp. Pas-s27]|nr:hypothetical protein [Gilliamella sp. Pas-s27]MWP46328.1 hypothetical protein [Gilliamella sp. Pas-s27]
MASEQFRLPEECKVRDLAFQILALELIEQLKNDPSRIQREVQTIIRN